MKCQNLFSMQNNNKKNIKSAAILIGVLRGKVTDPSVICYIQNSGSCAAC